MQELRKILAAIFVFVALIIVAFSIVFILKFHDYDFSNNIADWGSFGDYLGSILAAILGFATFVLLLWNIDISSRQFRSTRNHDEILLIYEIVKTTSDEINLALSESDKIGEFADDGHGDPTDFPLERLRDRRIMAPDKWHREEGFCPPGVQLAESRDIFESVCKLVFPERNQDDLEMNPFSWFDYFKFTGSPFYRLLTRLIRLNFLLRRIHELNPDSTLLAIYKSRFSTTASVLALFKYLKLDEEARFLIIDSDYELTEAYLSGWLFVPSPSKNIDECIEDVNAEIDAMRGEMEFE